MEGEDDILVKEKKKEMLITKKKEHDLFRAPRFCQSE